MRAAALLVAVTLAADSKQPHIHQGSLEPFKPGPPPPLTSAELALLAGGKTVTSLIRLPGQGGRAMATFDVPAPPETVWSCINDIKAYPKMVAGVSDVAIYDGPRSAGGGTTRTKARWTLSFLGYKVTYFNEMIFDPRQNSMTFRLDYSRNSDLDDTVGKWHVKPIPGPDGTTHSRVSYSASLTLRMWLPKTVVDMLFASTLGQATSWVGPEAKKRYAAAGGAAATTQKQRANCRWTWFGRRCAPPPPPPLPPPPTARAYMDSGVSLLAGVCVLAALGHALLG